MPSQRVGGAVTNLMMMHDGGAKFCYSMPGCTPQAYCRSESMLLSHAMTDMESWFPANGLSEMTGGASSPAVSQNFQRPSEKSTLGVNVDVDEVASAGITTAGLLSEYQADTWWPSISVHAKDHRSSQQDGISDDKPASTFTSCSTESWCTTNPVAVANVDLNTPSCELPSAIAVVSVAPALVSSKGGGSRSKKSKSFSAPTSPSELRKAKLDMRLGVQKATWNGKRPVSQRENHIWSERQRRKGMNYLFSTLRSLLPHPTSKTDKSTVVGEIIKYIQSLQVKLDILTKKRQHVMAARTLNTFHGGDNTAPKAFVSNGLTLVDHSSDPSSMTAITALPLPGSESGLQSYLGSNVGLHVCGLNVFITTSSPRGRSGLLQQLLVTIHKHDLDVINANISTSNASIFHYIHCQASPDEELLNNALHGDLQSMITNFEAPF